LHQDPVPERLELDLELRGDLQRLFVELHAEQRELLNSNRDPRVAYQSILDRSEVQRQLCPRTDDQPWLVIQLVRQLLACQSELSEEHEV